MKRFEPSKHKKILLSLFVIAIISFTSVWAQDKSNPLFHDPGKPDPLTRNLLWSSTDTTGAEWNLNGVAGIAQGTTCASYYVNGQYCILLFPDSTHFALALTKNKVDFSTISAKTLEMLYVWGSGINNCCGSVGNNAWGIYLTRNATFPGTSTTYDPRTDPSVAFMIQMYQTGGNCNHGTESGCQFEYDELIQHDNSKTVAQENSGCSPSSSRFLCPGTTFNPVPASGPVYMDSVMNFTGYTQKGATSCTIVYQSFGVSSFEGCSFLADDKGDNGSTKQYPVFNFQGVQYYIGLFATNTLGTNYEISFRLDQGAQTPAPLSVAFPNSGMEFNQATFSPGVSTPPNIDTGGLFGPLIKALISAGVFILNAILGFIAFISPAIQSAINFLETTVTTILNLIGNALGFGNIGTSLANFLNALINFFTQQFPQYIGNFPSYVTNFLSLLQIQFPFLAPLFTIANAILQFGVNGVAEGITILTIGLQMFLFGYGTLMVVAYFLYVGDDGIGGFFTYLGTLEALSFKILNLIATVTNLGIDILVHVMTLIPIPFIKIGGAHLPRLPTLESSASISFPKLDFAEARNGNLIVYWLWCMGLWFTAWFESRNPSLPGSIGALDPAVAANVRQLSAYIPLLQAATLISGGLMVIWFAMLPLNLAGIDVREAPIGASIGRLTGPGPSGVSLVAGKKHLIGKAKQIQKQVEAGKQSKTKKVEEAKEAIEKRKKELEEKKRSEELRKKELARKPSGKDLRGPNLQ